MWDASWMWGTFSCSLILTADGCMFGLAQIFVLFCFTQDTLTDTTLPYSWAQDQLNKGTLTISSQSQTRDPNRKETWMASPTSLLSWAAMSASCYFWLVDETAHGKLHLFESLRPYFWKYTPDYLQCFECHLAWCSPPKMIPLNRTCKPATSKWQLTMVTQYSCKYLGGGFVCKQIHGQSWNSEVYTDFCSSCGFLQFTSFQFFLI